MVEKYSSIKSDSISVLYIISKFLNNHTIIYMLKITKHTNKKNNTFTKLYLLIEGLA